MEKAGEAADAVHANIFQLYYFFGFSHNFLHNFVVFLRIFRARLAQCVIISVYYQRDKINLIAPS